jgi:hypothetical protein
MGDEREAFPSRARLWRGAVLGTIAHAIWVVAHPILAAAQGWDGATYLLNDGSGDRAAITFAPGRVAAAFFDLHSERCPFRREPRLPFGATYHTEDYFAGAPESILELARRETLQYLFDDYQGRAQPVITAACWSADEALTAREPWPQVCAHGAHLIAIQTLPPEDAMAAWAEEYELGDNQAALLRTLFARRIATSGPLTLDVREHRILIEQGEAGLAQSREIFAAIGIELP